MIEATVRVLVTDPLDHRAEAGGDVSNLVVSGGDPVTLSDETSSAVFAWRGVPLEPQLLRQPPEPRGPWQVRPAPDRVARLALRTALIDAQDLLMTPSELRTLVRLAQRYLSGR